MNAARQKVEDEGHCRVCGADAKFCDAAHVIDRSMAPGRKFDRPDEIVPLCSLIKGGNGCHDRYDAHDLALLPFLTKDEQAAAVRLVGITRAYRRTTVALSPPERTPWEIPAWAK